MDDKHKTVTYYDVLGIRRDASQETIRTAYRTMAKKLHPDMGGSTEAMNTLTHAYNVLSNQSKKERYDESLRKEQERTTQQAQSRAQAAQPSAQDLLNQERSLVAEVRKGAAKSIWIGIGLCVLGLVITGWTYSAASEGGTYFFAWGPILFGAIYFIRGLYNYLSPYSILHKEFDSSGYKHKFYLEKAGQPVKAVFIIIALLVGAVIVMGMIGSAGSGTSSSGGSSESTGLKAQYDSCTVTFRGIESELDSVNGQMDSYDAAGNTTAYNNLVDKQNSLVADYNTKHAECESYRTKYNNSLGN